MQETKTIAIFGEPVGKGRPRFARNGAYVRAYTPDKTRQYEENVAMIYRLRKGDNFGAEPVILKVDAYFSVPKSASKKAREEMLSGDAFCMKKPDADNIIKCIADALNGVAYNDDKQIVRCFCSKHYSDTPRVEITVLPAQRPERSENGA